MIGEVGDGQDAIQKAIELKPDLILLDVGLPILNGNAGRQMLTIAPASKIIFVTNESSAEVVQEAVDLGVMGYVQKIKGGIDLRVAVEE